VSFRVNRPVPYYRKLTLENKILVFFSIALLFAGLVVLGSVYWTTKRNAVDNLIARVSAVVQIERDALARAAAESDHDKLAALLVHAVRQDDTLAYVVVFDMHDRPLAGQAGSPAAGDLVSAYIDQAAQTASLAAGYREASLALVRNDAQVGSVRFAVAERRGIGTGGRAAGTALALMLMPGVLLLLISRIVVRRTIAPLKDLTRVADEISTGNLDPRIDFGVHVNCWEIMDCQQTTCDGYQNFTQQCWYIDNTPCEGYEPRFPQKLEHCRTCEVYQAHRGDELVQLADSFRHMANVLKSSREELVSSNDFQTRLIQSSFDGIVATNEHDVITIFNRVAERLIGLERDKVIGIKDWQEYFPDGIEKTMDIPLSFEPVRRMRGFPPLESAIRAADGRLVDVRLAGISLFERGRHIGKVFFFQDLREVVRLRERLIQSERMVAAGRAAAGISHSIKNILDGFNGGVYVYKMGKRRGDDRKMDTGWEMIERNVKIIGDLVNDLLNFAKERAPEYRAYDPIELVEAVIDDIGLPRDGPIRIHVARRGPKRKVMLDYHAFHQCLANLLSNAMDAFAPGADGNVTVEFGFTDSGGDTAFFTVTDDGIGMSPRTIAKIKEGMYSTKGSKGTGLGLQVVQKIVNEHHGVLSIASTEDEGSTFRIELPVAGQTSVEAEVKET